MRWAAARCRRACPYGERRIAGADALVCGTGYTGEDGVELLLDPADAPRVWDALVRRGARPAGLAARDTLRLEVCFHLYGNDLSEDRGPIEAGLGWACREDTGFIGADARAGGARGRPGRAARRLHRRRGGIAAPGQPDRRRRRGDERHDVAVARTSVSAWGSCPRAGRPRARADRDRRSRQDASRPRCAAKPLYRRPDRRRRPMAEASYPSTCIYHPEHDWVEHRRRHRDVRHHVVRPGRARGRWCSSTRPRSARRSRRTTRTPRSSQSRRSPTSIAPLSAGSSGSHRARRRARGDQRRPVRRGLARQGQASDPGETDQLLDQKTYTSSLG